MSHLYDNTKNKTKKGGYKHLNYTERRQIERWYNIDNKKPKEIAKLLGKSTRTINRELKRGMVENLTSELIVKKVYSADVAQNAYDYNMTSKGPDLKIGNDRALVKEIEDKIKKEKMSPEVVVHVLNLNFCAKTIRNNIKMGGIFDIEPGKIIYKKEHKEKNSNKVVCDKVPAEKSIDFRPEEANNRSVYGHWEGDLIVGKRKKGACLFTLTERKTRDEIIIKIPDKTARSVIKALNRLERQHGKSFKTKFLSITFDNGPEFRTWELMEQSILTKGKRTTVYYAHPYRSCERGSNENANRLIRRWIPKGTCIDTISKAYIKQVEDWINNYKRPMFGFKSTNEILASL